MISENASLTANANPSLATVPMSAYGYQQTLGDRRREVCFPLESRHRRRRIPDGGLLCPLTAQKRTSETSSLEVCC